MKIKVAIISPYDFMENIIDVGKTFPRLALYPFPYQDIKETVDIVQQCKDKVDVLFFAGLIPYRIACELVDNKPMVYLPHNGASLYRVFFQMLKENGYKEDGLRFSIDILKKEDIEERLDELNLSVEKMFVREYEIGQTAQDIIDFHYELWVNNEIDAVLTCFSSVYQKLVRLGVRCYRIIPTKLTIRECFHWAQLEGNSVHLSDGQLAIGIISVEDFTKKRNVSEYEIQRKKLSLQEMFIDYGEEIQALMDWKTHDEITFITTRGKIEKTTGNFNNFPLLDQVFNQLNLTLSIGIGLGRTANEAEQKAREALQKSKSNGGGSCYVIMPYGNVLGPLGNEFQLQYSVRTDESNRMDLARKANLSVGTINKLISFCKTHGETKITSTELASGFGITPRSARRILGKLEQSDLAVVVGEEQPLSKGRPRYLYDLKLDK